MTRLPVDLAPMPPELRPTRWIVFWPADDAGHWNETLMHDRALAADYAAAKRGQAIPFANLKPLPEGVR